jgi:peptidoglycan/LPS O-acetylase OafA/YrhL
MVARVTKAAPRIEQLTGLRGAAAVMVLIGHCGWIPAMPGLPNAGVAIFYSLSSFLLTYLALVERRKTGTFDIKQFILRRIIRVWPLYFIAVAVGVLLFPFWYITEWPWIVTFMSNWSMTLYGIAGHLPLQPSPIAILWSISVEEQFYVILPLLLPVLWMLRGRALLISIGTIILLGPISRTAFWLLTRDIAPPISAGGIYYATFSYIDAFALGGTAGAIFFFKDTNRLCRAICGSLKPWQPLLVLFFSMNAWAAAIWAPYTTTTVVMFSVVGIASAALILAIASTPGSITSQALCVRPMLYLGQISFSFYVWHVYAISLASSYFHANGIATFALATAFGTVSYFLVELQAMQFRKTLSASVLNRPIVQAIRR